MMRNDMIGKGAIEQAAHWLATLLQFWAETIFAGIAGQNAFGSVAWVDLIVMGCFLAVAVLIHVTVAAFLRRKIKPASKSAEDSTWREALWLAVGKPVYLLIWIYAIYFTAMPLLQRLNVADSSHPVRQFADGAFDLGVFISLVWGVFRLTHVLERFLRHLAGRSKSKLDDLLVPLVGRTLRVVVPLLGIILVLPLVGLSMESSEVVKKGSGLLIIGCIAWVLSQTVKVIETYVLSKYDIKATDNLEARKVYTQVQVISKTLYFLIALFTVASMLMLFDEVRRFGTSILASAGVVGIIIGFAAQRTIANLFAGFQLAMTQPIRIDDVVIVEGEWGRVEEITLTYVVIKIWDQRRLVVPLSHFIEKPFQNWTRVSSDIMGAVFLYADYTLPLEEVRKHVKQMVEAHPDWDRKFWNLQVTDSTERSMQIRVLVTASDSGKAWNLRCDLRERLIAFIQKNHPGCLPKTRAELERGPAKLSPTHEPDLYSLSSNQNSAPSS